MPKIIKSAEIIASTIGIIPSKEIILKKNGFEMKLELISLKTFSNNNFLVFNQSKKTIRIPLNIIKNIIQYSISKSVNNASSTK